jgi:very-short-patch-repair endonuclease
LLDLGLSRGQLDRLRAQGLLVCEADAVYRLTAAPRTDDQLAAIACATSPDVVVSHVSAGRTWGFRRMGRDDRLHVTMNGRSNRLVPGVVIHRSHRIDEVDIIEHGDGIRVTGPPRTVFDLAATVRDDALASIVEQLLHDSLCSLATLLATGDRLAERGRTGSARFRRVLASRPTDAAALASDLELRFEEALVEAGLPRPLRQHPIALLGGVIHPDFYWPDEREIVEVDHVTWHGGKADLTYDKRRDRELWRRGIHVTRVTDDEIRFALTRVVADIAAILRSRAA